MKRFILKYNTDYILDGADPKWIYLKSNPEKRILCKHHLYMVQLESDKNMIDILKGDFGGPPKDGFIYCKNCGELLCEEDYSTLEGLGEDDAPVTTRAKMDEKEVNIIEQAELDESQKEVINISNIFANSMRI